MWYYEQRRLVALRKLQKKRRLYYINMFSALFILSVFAIWFTQDEVKQHDACTDKYRD